MDEARQKYGNSPLSLKTNENLSSVSIPPELNFCGVSLLVAVCGASSLFIQVTFGARGHGYLSRFENESSISILTSPFSGGASADDESAGLFDTASRARVISVARRKPATHNAIPTTIVKRFVISIEDFHFHLG